MKLEFGKIFQYNIVLMGLLYNEIKQGYVTLC